MMKKNPNPTFRIIGLMSGTSLDGLDIAFCIFKFSTQGISFEIPYCETVDYPEELVQILKESKQLSSEELILADKKLGRYFGEKVNAFIHENNIDRQTIDAISSHGHTVFHQPHKGFTLQIGCGASVSKETGILVINDFRTKDVLHGGQGAPLVPKGDFDLFGEVADGFLNLGGFANISFKKGNIISAYDISPCNLPLNYFANLKNLNFDEGGKLAACGQIHEELLSKLNLISYYQENGPKSLGTEWLDSCFYSHFIKTLLPEDSIRTCLEHISFQISKQIEENELKKILISGGGAKNDFLVNQIQAKTKAKLIIPEKNIIDFKEALIFAYLGALNILGLPNNVPSVTGATKEICGGVRHEPN